MIDTHQTPSSMKRPRVAAVIASTGRTQVLRSTILSVMAQASRPERLIVAVIKESDCDVRPGEIEGVEVILARKGLSAQLNDAVALMDGSVDYVCFFDDDVVLVADYIEKMVGFMESRSDIVALSGYAFRDGNVSQKEAEQLVKNPPETSPMFYDKGKHWVLYGCNMVIRRPALAREKFDERFVLYAWMFEVEITYRLLAYGKVGRYSGGRLIHLKVQTGRMSGLRFGYSEVANRFYLATRPALASRRCYIVSWALYNSFKSTLLNAINSWRKRDDPFVDYQGRFRGNLRAWRDLTFCKIIPERINTLS